jgi:hypothetical protein
LTLEHMELEASKGDKQLRGILSKIKENTRLTNQILSELEAEQVL